MKDKSSSDRRARVEATKEERVAYIMTEIAEGRWRGYRSTRECAETFGISVRALESDAAEAGRTLHHLHAGTPEQREEARGRQLARLEKWREVAMTAGRDGVPDMGAIARLEDLEARIVGTLAPTKVETKNVLPQSPDDLRAMREQAAEALTALDARLAELDSAGRQTH